MAQPPIRRTATRRGFVQEKKEIPLTATGDPEGPGEGWHVIQPQHGRMKPAKARADIPVREDSALEREADRMGAEAAKPRPGEPESR